MLGSRIQIVSSRSSWLVVGVVTMLLWCVLGQAIAFAAQRQVFSVRFPVGWAIQETELGQEALIAGDHPALMRLEAHPYSGGRSTVVADMKAEVAAEYPDGSVFDGPAYASENGIEGLQFEIEVVIDGADWRGWVVVVDQPQSQSTYQFTYWTRAADFDTHAEEAIATIANLELSGQAAPAEQPGTNASQAAPGDGAGTGRMPATAPARSDADVPLQTCDLEAADPVDPDRLARISNTDEFGLPANPQGAFEACREAMVAWPHTARFKIYLANVLDGLRMEPALVPLTEGFDDVALVSEAAVTGYRHAIFRLGLLALDGRYLLAGSSTQDSAVKLLEQAADKGHARAMTVLAQVLEGSKGSYPHFDPERAARLFLDALRAGDDAAREALLVYPESRSPETIASVQRLLAARGLYAGTIDGRFGPRTRSAIERSAVE